MAKNKVSEWSATASNNTDISGINIAEGCAPSGINNAIRELMAQVKDMQTGADGDGLVVGGAFTASGAAVFSSTVSATGAVTLNTALGVTSGGTGVNSVTTGDILYSSAVNTISKLAATTTGNVLLSGSTPSWGKVALTSAVSGALPVGNGGTGATTLTDKAVLIGSGTSTITSVSPGSDDNVLMSDGTSWTSAPISTISAFDKSHGTNGYQKFPGGLMIQWGSVTLGSGSGQSFNFPTEFPNNCFFVIGLENGADTTSNLPATTITKTGVSNINPASSGTYIWLAIGN
jgi:hypothetical protein